jgi:hypothetical protein
MEALSPLYSRGVGCDQSALMGTPLTFPLNSWGNNAFRKPNVVLRDRMERRGKSIEPATRAVLFRRKSDQVSKTARICQQTPEKLAVCFNLQ